MMVLRPSLCFSYNNDCAFSTDPSCSFAIYNYLRHAGYTSYAK